MKKTVLFVFTFLFLSHVLSAQVNVTWGSRFHDLNDFAKNAQIVGEDPDGYYMWYCAEEYLGDGQYGINYYMARFGKDNQIRKIVRMDFRDRNISIAHVFRSGENIGFILAKTAKKSQKITLYKQFFQTRDMRLMGSPEEFKTFVSDGRNRGVPYLFAFSANGQKIGLCIPTLQDTTKSSNMRLEIYDQRLRLLWERTYSPVFPQNAYAYESMSVSDDGTRAVVGVNTFQDGKKADRSAGVIALYWFTEYKGRKHELQLPEAWAQSFRTAFNVENDYVVAGYYGNNPTRPHEGKGTFSFLFEDNRGSLKKQESVAFKSDENTDVSLPSDMFPKDSMRCYADYLLPMMNGNVVLIGEECFDFKPRPARRNQKASTQPAAMHFRNIHVTAINKNGTIVSDNYVPKRQVTTQGTDLYNSYALTKDRYNVYLMFNDHIANFDKGVYRPQRNYNSDKMRTIVNFVKIFPDGSYRWHEANRTTNMKMPFFQTIYLTAEKQIVFFSRYEENNIMGSFDTK